MKYLVTGILQNLKDEVTLYSEEVEFDKEYKGPSEIYKLYDKVDDIAEKYLRDLPSEEFGPIKQMDQVTVWRRNEFTGKWMIIER